MPGALLGAWPPRCDTAAILDALLHDALLHDGNGGQALTDLLQFRHLKKWTTALFAERWGCSEDTAQRALRKLHLLGLLGCLQGEGRSTTGQRHGGRGPDVWFLTPCGARVLNQHLQLAARRVREPAVARGAPVLTAGGLWKYKDATPQSRTLIAHDLACVRLALREGCLEEGTNWTMRHQLRFTDRWTGAQVLTPDFAVPLVTPAEPLLGRPAEHFTCYVEVEGTNELPHILEKHHRYAALVRALREERSSTPFSRAYANELDLVLVLTFSREQRQQRQTMLRRHTIAYANRRDGANYRVAWIDLADLLAAPTGQPVWQLAEPIDYDRERDRLRAYWNRQPGNVDTGDFEL